MVPLDGVLERRTMTSIPGISARGSLILWAKCQIPVGPRPCVGPRSGREGEKCRPLDHMRQIPFIHQLCSHPTVGSISIYIQNCSSHFFHVVSTLCLGTLYICHLRMRFPRTSYFQRHFEEISYVLLRDTMRHRSQTQIHRKMAVNTLSASYHLRS